MAWLRFPLMGLVLIVGVAAVSFAGIRFAPELWANTAFLASLVGLLGAILPTIYCRGERRAFWVGFLLFGWGYMLMVFGPWFSTYVGPYLGTSTLLGYLYRWIGTNVGVAITGLTLPHVYRGGHSLLAMLLAYIGGLLARHLHRGRDSST